MWQRGGCVCGGRRDGDGCGKLTTIRRSGMETEQWGYDMITYFIDDLFRQSTTPLHPLRHPPSFLRRRGKIATPRKSNNSCTSHSEQAMRYAIFNKVHPSLRPPPSTIIMVRGGKGVDVAGDQGGDLLKSQCNAPAIVLLGVLQ